MDDDDTLRMLVQNRLEKDNCHVRIDKDKCQLRIEKDNCHVRIEKDKCQLRIEKDNCHVRIGGSG